MQNPDNERHGMIYNLNMFIMNNNEETQASSRSGFCFREGYHDNYTKNLEVIRKVRKLVNDDDIWINHLNENSELWNAVHRFSFSWFFVPTNSQPSLNEPFSENCYLFAFHIMCLILLDLKPGVSFLHINSMNGYVNQLAGWMIGRKGRNHGIELRTNRCTHAHKLTKRVFRLSPSLEWRMTRPRFHARYPRDLLRGEVKFDRILITDYFTSIEEIQRFRRFLSPAGRLVTGFQNRENESKIICLKRSKKFETFPMIQLGSSGSIHESLREQCYMTFKGLESDGVDMSPHEHSTIDSLHFLALRTLSFINDPFEEIRDCALTDPSLMHEALWSDNQKGSIYCASSTIVLEPFTNAILTFKERCDAFVPYILETNDGTDSDNGSTDLHSPCLDSLAKVLDTINETVSQCVGQENYEKWKNNTTFLNVPIVHGMLIQHLESVCLFVQYSKVPFRCYCPKEVVLARNSNCFHVRVIDSDRTISLSPRLINRVVKEFEGLNTSFFSLELPYYCHELKTRRIEIDLAFCCAKQFSDLVCIISITKLMFKEVKEKLKSVPEDIRELEGIVKLYQRTLDELFETIRLSERFDVAFVQSMFSPIVPYAQKLYSYVLLMLDHLRRTDVIMELVHCSSIILVDIYRNIVSCPHTYWVDDEGYDEDQEFGLGASHLDQEIFEDHIHYLCAEFEIKEDAEAIFSYMVRRCVSILKELYWRIKCESLRQKTKKLEEDPCFYYQQCLLPYFTPNEAERLLSLEEDGIDALID